MLYGARTRVNGGSNFTKASPQSRQLSVRSGTPSASISCSVKTVLRYLFDSICLFLAAAGLLAVLVASFMISALVVAWDQDSRLQHEDWRMMATAAQWLVGSS